MIITWYITKHNVIKGQTSRKIDVYRGLILLTLRTKDYILEVGYRNSRDQIYLPMGKQNIETDIYTLAFNQIKKPNFHISIMKQQYFHLPHLSNISYLNISPICICGVF